MKKSVRYLIVISSILTITGLIYCFLDGYYVIGNMDSDSMYYIDYEEIAAVTLILGTLGLSLSLFSYYVSVSEKKEAIRKAEEKEKERKREASRALLLAKRERDIQLAKAKFQSYINLYGEITKSIQFINGRDEDLSSQIVVYGESKVFSLFGRVLRFDEVIGAHYDDTPTIKKGKSKSVTKADEYDLTKKELMYWATDNEFTFGDLLNVKKVTTTEEGDTITIHNYKVYLNIKDLSTPVIKINIGASQEFANEIVGLFNAIIAMK